MATTIMCIRKKDMKLSRRLRSAKCRRRFSDARCVANILECYCVCIRNHIEIC